MIITTEATYIIFTFPNEGIIFPVIKPDTIPKRDAINNTIPITNGDNPCPLPNSNGNNNKLAHNATLMINPTAIKRSNGLFVNNSILINGDLFSSYEP